MVELIPNTRSLITGGDAEIEAYIRDTVGNEFAWTETINPCLCASGVPTQNTTFFMRPEIGRLPKAQSFTKARVYNVATVNGNHAISIWTSDGTTLTRLAGTGSVAQAGVNAVQTHDLAFTVPADTDWFISLSSDSATGTYLWKSGWAGTLKTAGGHIKCVSAAGFNVTANQTIASLSSAGAYFWVEVS